MEARRFMPGMPVAINIGNGGDRRRKRRMAWAVMSDGSKSVPPDKISVSCAGKELLEVSKDAVQPFQVSLFHLLREEPSACDSGCVYNECWLPVPTTRGHRYFNHHLIRSLGIYLIILCFRISRGFSGMYGHHI